MSQVLEVTLEKTDIGNEEESRIILFNDEVNTFDWVIKSLMDVLDHSSEQAEQCAIIAHYKGKVPVKTGKKAMLIPGAEALGERGLTVEIE